jgi:hypothetical protein
MPVSQLLVNAVIVGIVVNIYDFVVHGVLLHGPLYSKLPLMRPDASVPLLIATDFVAALVFVWVYQRVRTSFAPGAAGGATFGLYAGILMSFPTWISCYLLIQGFTYGLAWAWILTGILWAVLAGTVVGALSRRTVPVPAAA